MKVYYDFETMFVKPDNAELKLEVLMGEKVSIMSCKNSQTHTSKLCIGYSLRKKCLTKENEFFS